MKQSIFEKIKYRIYCRLVNRNTNAVMLRHMPFRPWMDLAIVYYYQADQKAAPSAGMLITNEHLHAWKISEAELFELAWRNTAEQAGVFFQPLEGVLREEFEEEIDPSANLYLLSSASRRYGAIVICNPELLKQTAEFLDGSFFILPSSIHECLIFKDDGMFTKEELSFIVRSVNEGYVQKEEVLAEHVFFFDRSRQEILHM